MFFLHIPGSYVNIDGDVTFLLYDFLNDVEIQVILAFKNSLGKYHQVCIFGDLLYK